MSGYVCTTALVTSFFSAGASSAMVFSRVVLDRILDNLIAAENAVARLQRLRSESAAHIRFQGSKNSSVCPISRREPGD